ncbi:hypothetical protein C8Q72DRAFT_905869 [Fomitopsis betulina]|nr:hypothetical protein C8Q72DRAFT_905869 [Fomitopsis betulina]
MPRRILIGFGVDIDAVAGWLGSYGGEDSVTDISRGLYAGEVGVPRLLRLFDKYGIRQTFNIPGHSLDTFPEQMALIRDAGHEIGLHGYSHENPTALTLQQQKDILDHTYDQLTKFNNGIPPKGYVAPWCEMSAEVTRLLLDKGVEWDHSHMARDSQAYYLRDEDTWTKINYSARAGTWMKPLERGQLTGMIELPVNWYLDDMEPLMFAKAMPNMHGWQHPRDVEDIWKDMFTYLYREEQNFIFPITIHPDVSGHPHVLLMMERFIEWINTHENVHWVPWHEMAKEFREKNPQPTARAPAEVKGADDSAHE